MDRDLHIELRVKTALWALLIALTWTLVHQTGDCCMPQTLPAEVATVTTPAGQTFTINFPGH